MLSIKKVNASVRENTEDLHQWQHMLQKWMGIQEKTGNSSVNLITEKRFVENFEGATTVIQLLLK